MEQELKLVNYTAEKARLVSHDNSVVVELYAFGGILVSEAQQRWGQIDSKLTGYLAISIGIVALIGAGNIDTLTGAGRVATSVAMATAVLAIMASIVGLRSRLSAFPSELDWFSEKNLGDALRLRRFYVLALLKAHQIQQTETVEKAKMLPVAEGLLALSAFAVVASIVSRLF